MPQARPVVAERVGHQETGSNSKENAAELVFVPRSQRKSTIDKLMSFRWPCCSRCAAQRLLWVLGVVLRDRHQVSQGHRLQNGGKSDLQSLRTAILRMSCGSFSTDLSIFWLQDHFPPPPKAHFESVDTY